MKKSAQILPIIGLAVILGPHAASLLKKDEPVARAPVARAPDPKPVEPPATPEAWFARVKDSCTPADVTLTTDLIRPPPGVEGAGYKAACFALANQISRARALLLSLPETDRVRGASLVYDVAQQLAGEGKHDAAGPLMELFLEFWPNHYLALYEAGTARYAAGDVNAARGFLTRFLEVYIGNDDLTANAHRMMDAQAER